MSNGRVKFGTFYWVVSADPLKDTRPVYCAMERGDSFDQRVYEEGRYYRTERKARLYIRRLKSRLLREKAKARCMRKNHTLLKLQIK